MEDILSFLQDKAIDLSSVGTNNFALAKKDALELIDKFIIHNILLYGGDFLKSDNGELQYTYTNWSTNGNDIKGNLLYAKQFIEKYADDDTFIEFVTKDDLYKMYKTGS